MSVVAPFPFERLPKVARADLAAHALLRSAVIPFDALARALEVVVGVPVTIRVVRARAFDANRPTAVGAAFADADGEVHFFEVEPALARELVARALKHPPSKPTDSTKPMTAGVSGAFAAVIHHALRTACAPPLHAVGTVPQDLSLTAWLAITVNGATFEARVSFIPRPHAPTPLQDDFPIALPLVVATCIALRADIEALAAGDVFVVPGISLTGEVMLIAPREERGLLADLAVDGRLVIRTGRFAHAAWDGNEPMTPDQNPTLEVVLDAPVVVRIELGVVEMKAREWASVAEGDVIPLGKKLGDPAVLRIAGTEVARGELVQVDGEYGIRIVGTNR